jgi:hypothetical protein
MDLLGIAALFGFEDSVLESIDIFLDAFPVDVFPFITPHC